MKDFGRVDAIERACRHRKAVFTPRYHDFLAVSMHGAFYTLREGARLMVKRAEAGEPGGSLVFCGSLSMFKGMPAKRPMQALKAPWERLSAEWPSSSASTVSAPLDWPVISRRHDGRR